MMILKRLAQWGENIVKFLIKGGAYVGITVLVLMMLLEIAEVFLRYAFNKPIFGDIEMIEAMMVTVAFLAIAYCALENGNVKMDFFIKRFPRRVQEAVETIGYTLCLAVAIPMTWHWFPQIFYAHRLSLSSPVLYIPTFPFYIIAFFSCLMLSIVLLINLGKSVARLVK